MYKTPMKSGELLVRQDNDLINFSYRLTTVEQKIVRILISKIDKLHGENNTLFTISLNEFSEVMNLDRTDNPHSFLINSIHNLQDKTIYPGKTTKKLRIKWFASVEELENGNFEVEISDKLLPYLLELSKCYTAYKLRFVINFQSTHAFRIYELGKQYEKIGCREIKVDELKWILGVQEKYPRYYDFRKKVLLPSLEEINTKSDILIDFIENKSRKATISLKFIIKQNSNNLSIRQKIQDKIRNNFTPPPLNEIALKLIEKFGFSKTQSSKIAVLWADSEEKLDMVCNKIAEQNKKTAIKNLKAYAAKVLLAEGQHPHLV